MIASRSCMAWSLSGDPALWCHLCMMLNLGLFWLAELTFRCSFPTPGELSAILNHSSLLILDALSMLSAMILYAWSRVLNSLNVLLIFSQPQPIPLYNDQVSPTAFYFDVLEHADTSKDWNNNLPYRIVRLFMIIPFGVLCFSLLLFSRFYSHGCIWHLCLLGRI